LLRKPKTIFRSFRSRPVSQLTEQINPILRGWVNYFAIGHSSRCFGYIRGWVEKKIRRHLARAAQRQGFGWKRWSREWLYATLGLFHTSTEFRILSRLRQPPRLDRPHNPCRELCRSASAVDPHAARDVADVGNGTMENPNRPRRGKPRTQAKDDPKGTAPASDPTSTSTVQYYIAVTGAKPVKSGIGITNRSALPNRWLTFLPTDALAPAVPLGTPFAPR
jgi:hypothetical protein